MSEKRADKLCIVADGLQVKKWWLLRDQF